MEQKFKKVVDQLVGMVAEGKLIWNMPYMLDAMFPCNHFSNRPYNGINVLITLFIKDVKGYTYNRWMTFKQARYNGGSVKKGEKGTTVIFNGKTKIKDDKTGEDKWIWISREHTVFNVDQTTIEYDPKTVAIQERLDVDQYLAPYISSLAKFNDNYDGIPNYTPGTDTVNMPGKHSWQGGDSDNMYHTLYHELIHSTGHSSRLDRPMLGHGEEQYSYEELVAEIGSVFLAMKLGTAPKIDNSAAYIQGWSSKLQGREEQIIKAASAANTAINWIDDICNGIDPKERYKQDN